MLLKSLDGFELEFTIVGYEFPDILNSCWDSNWLNMLLRVVAPNGTGKSIGPIMTTWEAAAFAQWLGAYASHQSNRSAGSSFLSDEFIFTEPNLHLSVIASGRDTVALSAHFVLERPGS